MKLHLRIPGKLCLTFVFLIALIKTTSAQTIKGKVYDAGSGEPLTGASVQAEQGDFKQYTSVNLDGSYIFRNLKPGIYQLKARFIGYKTTEGQTVELQANATVVVNLKMQNSSTSLSEVKVKGQASKETDGSARGIEKNASSIENVLSANTIQLLPDVTVGNAMQRVSGVTIQRTSSGEGRYAIIRGMEQRYNNTLVNGIKIPSPDDRFRFVPLDIFPSEMLERLEVIKALTPTMEGDAIGGTMNLVMKSAPDHWVINANASAGYTTLFSSSRPFSAFNRSGINKQSPAEINGSNYAATYKDFNNTNLNYHPINNPVNTTMGLTIGNRFLDKKLGVVLSASYQNIYRGSNSGFLQPNAQPTTQVATANSPTLSNVPTFSDYYNRQYSTQTSRIGIHNKIDYVLNDKNRFSLYNLYLHQDEYQTRLSVDTTLGPNSVSNSKAIQISNRSIWTQQNVYNSTLHGDHQVGRLFSINWNAVYSIAKRDVPDYAEYTLDNAISLDNNGNVTGVSSRGKSLTHRWEHNSDQDLAAYLNFVFTPKIANRDVELSFGGLYRHKTRNNYYNEYDFKPLNSTASFTDINSYQFGFNSALEGTGNYTTTSALDYHSQENTASEYLQAKFMLTKKLQVLGGVRIENTAQNYNTNTAIIYPERSGVINYTDVLPSLHLKYLLSNNQNIRASYFASISRPGYGEIVPYLRNGEYYDERGNPDLLHTQADNYDLRYELFPGGADQVLLGTFYKHLINPIEYSIVRDFSKPGTQYLEPVNGNSATNYGLEAQVTKYVKQFGVSANYTFTQSKVVQSKSYVNYNTATGQPQPIQLDQTRPLQGQAKHVGNMSLLYKNQKTGLDIQVAYVYTGERIAQVSGYYQQDYWQRPYGQLDFSFEKRVFKLLSIYGKVNNLTNASSQLFLKYPKSTIAYLVPAVKLPQQDNSNDILLSRDIYKVSFLAGLRYKFN